MKRLHLFEFEDLKWFPDNLRDYGTDFLAFIANTFDIYKTAIPVIRKGLEQCQTNHIVDLASGGGGGLLKLARHLKEDNPALKITLTDYYPNTNAFRRTVSRESGIFDFEKERVNATDVPSRLRGLRTMFLSFHHFRPDMARKILQDAVTKKVPIVIFEAQQRNIPHLIPVILSPVNVLLTTPFIRPFRLGRILFTYLIPVVPLFVLWDSDSFEWEVGVKRSRPGKILFLLGIPKENNN